jgi:hypothetical protein
MMMFVPPLAMVWPRALLLAVMQNSSI